METKNKTQIVFIHGGDSFATKAELYEFLRNYRFDPYASESKKWREWIKESLIDTHECFMPRMPNAWAADFTAWSIWFEKLVPHLRDEVILVGHSLGGGFLLRYLTEHTLPVRISQLHLVAPVVDAIECPGVGDFVINVATWSHFASRIEAVHLWHSSDDTLVPMHHSERFKVACPEAVLHTFTDRWHLLQSEFPELLAVIKA